ncbi:MAG: PEGA domain-containing protein, partial [Myxococcota bacterium]|nr:PEGA domain-containing protein [Myxococcota bacterium]
SRSLDELRKQMDSAPVREMDIEPAGPRWELLGVVAIVMLLLVAWWVFQPFSADTPTPPPPGTEAARFSAPARDRVAEPAPSAVPTIAGKVTVNTTPAGARIRLDDRSYGRSPATVPVPRDDRVHQLCAEPEDGAPVCRDVTGRTLGAKDPYEFPLDEDTPAASRGD